MVINNFNTRCISIIPNEANSPLVIYSYAVLTDSIAEKLMVKSKDLGHSDSITLLIPVIYVHRTQKQFFPLFLSETLLFLRSLFH